MNPTSILPEFAVRRTLGPLLLYTYLQALDLMTTLAFMLAGVQEGNPVVRWAMVAAPNPLGGLVAVKVAALMLGVSCWGTGRLRLLRSVNLFYALLVAWNLVCLVLGLAGK